MELRDYQQAALDKSLERYRAGVNRQLLVMATGLGKAVLFAALRQNHNFQEARYGSGSPRGTGKAGSR